MNVLKNMTLGTRLGAGFATVLALTAIMITLAIMRFVSVGELSDKIITKDWVKADAAATINATTRANARRTLELLLVTDQVAVAKIHERIDGNKKQISEALETLDKLVYAPEGKKILAGIKESRVAYVASFSKVDKMVAEGKRDEATKLMFAETLSREHWDQQANPLCDGIKNLVAVHRLREVSCLYGFTRFEAAPTGADGEIEDVHLAVRGAPISRDADWLPAIEQFGELPAVASAPRRRLRQAAGAAQTRARRRGFFFADALEYLGIRGFVPALGLERGAARE